jgi:hypothetical protein
MSEGQSLLGSCKGTEALLSAVRTG